MGNHTGKQSVEGGVTMATASFLCFLGDGKSFVPADGADGADGSDGDTQFSVDDVTSVATEAAEEEPVVTEVRSIEIEYQPCTQHACTLTMTLTPTLAGAL